MFSSRFVTALNCGSERALFSSNDQCKSDKQREKNGKSDDRKKDGDKIEEKTKKGKSERLEDGSE